MKTRQHLLQIVAAGLALAAAFVRAQSVSEPPTVFYGKVLGTGSAQPFLITEGELAWTIQRHDGTAVTLRTQLFALGDGLYSYRLEVPHSAIALGLPSDPGGVPLPPTPEVSVHASVTVDGQRATLLGPAPSAFTAEQILRTATHRLDLGLDREAADSDGDGIADWWEDAHGLDKQDAADAARDANGDGITALAAYLRGLDPARDARVPAVLTTELVVYPAGTTAILPDTTDIDTPPEQIVYTLTGLPAGGTLSLRQANPDPAHPDRVLVPGAQFTHADVLRGRLVFDHDGSGKPPGALAFAVHDGDAAHPATEAVIGLTPFAPGDYVSATLSDLEAQRILNHHHAAAGYVVLDAASLPRNAALAVPSAGLTGDALAAHRATYGDDRRALLVGAAGETGSLAGGQQDDVLMPGAGAGTLAGGPGSDAFVFRDFASGRVAIADFAPAEADEIDFAAFPAAPGAYAHQHLKLAPVAGGYELRTDLDGDGAGFTNRCVALAGLDADEADLYALIAAGRLRVDGLRLMPRVSVAATVPQAAENGPVPGQFTVTREGDLSADLTVSLGWSGTAENGKDYVLAPVTVLLPAGCASRDLVILPYDDGLTEAAETVLLSLAAGTDYLLGASSQASVTIGDLRMLLTVEAQKPLACLAPAASGRFILRRSGVTQSPVDVFLNIRGTAANGQDYEWISDWVAMAANQVTAVISVVPRATALLTGGAETVDLSIAPDAAYLTLATNVARVVIIERTDTFADWAAREFVVTYGIEAFAAQDPGGSGITHFQRYAYGLDPHHPSTDGLPRPIIRNGRLVVTFRKPLGRKDVRHTVIGMTNLRDPAGSKVDTRLFQPVPADDDPQRVYYELVPAAQGAPCAFMEVKAEWIQIP
jgi:hypothetical protein